VEIIITVEELKLLLAKALNADVTHIAFIPDDRVIIGTNLNIFGLNRQIYPVTPPNPPHLKQYLTTPKEVPVPPPESSPEEMAQIMTESHQLEGIVYEYSQDGEVTTRERNESEANLPPGEPIIYVRSNRDE
jgi:hypothetical protein